VASDEKGKILSRKYPRHGRRVLGIEKIFWNSFYDNRRRKSCGGWRRKLGVGRGEGLLLFRVLTIRGGARCEVCPRGPIGWEKKKKKTDFDDVLRQRGGKKVRVAGEEEKRKRW